MKDKIFIRDYYEGLVEGEHIGTKKVVDWVNANAQNWVRIHTEENGEIKVFLDMRELEAKEW